MESTVYFNSRRAQVLYFNCRNCGDPIQLIPDNDGWCLSCIKVFTNPILYTSKERSMVMNGCGLKPQEMWSEYPLVKKAS